jgi:hypothetical protein
VKNNIQGCGTPQCFQLIQFAGHLILNVLDYCLALLGFR